MLNPIYCLIQPLLPAKCILLEKREGRGIAVKLRINVIGRSKKGGHCPQKKLPKPMHSICSNILPAKQLLL